MGSDHGFLMLVAVDRAGRRRPPIRNAVVSRRFAQRLIAMLEEPSGAILDPGAVLDALDTVVPEGRESRNEHSAVVELALVAEARGMVLECNGRDPTTWTPAQDPEYFAADVQAALSVISEQLDCTVEDAAHRLFALVDESNATLVGTSRDVVSGRLSFIGSPTGPTVGMWLHHPD